MSPSCRWAPPGPSLSLDESLVGMETVRMPHPAGSSGLAASVSYWAFIPWDPVPHSDPGVNCAGPLRKLTPQFTGSSPRKRPQRLPSPAMSQRQKHSHPPSNRVASGTEFVTDPGSPQIPLLHQVYRERRETDG